jgi:resuscitation-promoting factor RpfA
MKQAVPYLGRFLSKFVFEIIPGALVSVVAAYFLSMLHLAQGAEPTADPPTLSALQNDGLSADERRELTRHMLKERRENPEEPAEVKPVPSLRPSAPAPETADAAPEVIAPIAPQIAAPQIAAPQFTTPQVTTPQVTVPEAKPRPEPARPAVAAVAPAPPATPLPRPPAARVRTEPAPAAAAPPAAPTTTASLPPAPAAAPAGATPLPPVTVNTSPANAAAEPQPRGFVGNVFSGISTIAGGAANVTGNTVNWVIDLPGKAISAGGRLLTGNPAPAAAPAPPAAPVPAAAPAVDPQRRNCL